MQMLTRVIRIDANGRQWIGLQLLNCGLKDFLPPLPVQHTHEFFGDEDSRFSVGVRTR